MISRLGPTVRPWFATNYALLLFLGLGLVAYVMRSLGWFQMMPGDLSDSRFNNVILEHLFLWTSGKTESLLSPDFFYPYQNVLAFSDNHFGSGPVYVFFRFIGFDRYAAYQLWFLVGHILNVVAAYWALRRLGFAPVAAAAGAFVYAFALPNLPKEGHSQLTYRFGAILAFATFWKALTESRPKLLVESAFWTVWQFFCTIYVGFFSIFLMAAVAVALLVLDRGRPVFSLIKAIAGMDGARHVRFWGALLLLAGALMWLLAFYASTGHDYGFERTRGEILSLMPQIQSYFIADRSAIWGPISRQIGETLENRWEQQMFFGLAALALAAWGTAIAFRTKTEWSLLGRVAAVSFAMLAALTLLTPFGSLYFAVLNIPGISAIRAVARFAIILSLPLALLVAIAASRLLDKGWNKAAVAAGLAAFLGVEVAAYQPYNQPRQAWEDRLANLESQVKIPLNPSTAFFVTGVERDPFWIEIDAMMLAQKHGSRTVNGYSGNLAPGYVRPEPCASPFTRIVGLVANHRRGTPPIDILVEWIEPIQLQPCPWQTGNTWLDGPIDPGLPAMIAVSVAPTSAQNIYSVSLSNQSDKVLSTLSASNQPVRLSWRWTGSSTSAESTFDTRMDLGFDLPPGSTQEFPVVIPDPPDSSAKRLEVSLVQEGVIWFHNSGMNVGVYEVPVHLPE